MMMMLHWELASSAGLKECSCFYFDPQSLPDLLQLLLDFLFGLGVVVEGHDLPAFKLLGHSSMHSA
jgi:hypothetical protein